MPEYVLDWLRAHDVSRSEIAGVTTWSFPECRNYPDYEGSCCRVVREGDNPPVYVCWLGSERVVLDDDQTLIPKEVPDGEATAQ